MAKSVFIGGATFDLPPGELEFYHSLREAVRASGCTPFLAQDLDWSDIPKALSRTETAIQRADLAVFGLEYPPFSHDAALSAGTMIQMSAKYGKPRMYVYDVAIEKTMKRKDPGVWQRATSSEEMNSQLGRNGITIISSPTALNPFLVHDSFDPLIVHEVKYSSRDQAPALLEAAVRNYFRK